MTITSKAWQVYVDKMSAVSATGGALMQQWIDQNGVDDLDAMVDYAYYLSIRYGEAIAELACEMYEAIAESQGVAIDPAEPTEMPTRDDLFRKVTAFLILSDTRVQQAVETMIKQIGQDTVLRNARRDGAYFAWIPHGSETCPYCMGIAAEGWKRAGKKTYSGTHAEHIHSSCKCQYAVDFKGDLKIEKYDPDEIKANMANLTGMSEDEVDAFVENLNENRGGIENIVNQVRNAQREENADFINAQKREAYERKHPVRGATDTGEAIVMSDGRKIPYGTRKGFNGMTREQAIEQAKRYTGNKDIK